MIRFSSIPGCLLGILLSGGLMTVPAVADTITIGGTGGDLGTMKLLGQAYAGQHPEDSVKVFPSLGSGGGIRALLAGRLDLAISSRPPKQKEIEAGASSFVYGVTALAPTAQNNRQWQGLSSQDVVTIFSSDNPVWPDGSPLRLVTRPQRDSDMKLLAQNIPGLAAAFEKLLQRNPLVGLVDQDAADLLEQAPGAFGFISLSLVLGEQRNLKILPLDGVVANLASIEAKTYPVTKAFHMVIGPQSSPAAQRFVDFMRSENGIKLLRQTGHAAP